MNFVGQPLPRIPPKPKPGDPQLPGGPLREFEPIAFDWPVGFKFGPGASPRLPVHLDAIFKKFGGGLPIGFLRTLAAFESRMNPRAHRKGSRYYGLFQISTPTKKNRGVLGDYNKAHGTKFTRDDMFNVANNTQVAAWYLNLIIKLYARQGIRALAPASKWLDPEWVKLLVQGWHGGPFGVVKVAKWMKAHGAHIDHDGLSRNAKKAGVTAKTARVLQDAKKHSWEKRLGAVFTRERRFVPKTGPMAKPTVPPRRIATKGMSPWLILILLFLLRSKK